MSSSGQLGAGRERPVEVLALAGGDIVEHQDLVPGIQESVHQVGSDEARTACDE